MFFLKQGDYTRPEDWVRKSGESDFRRWKRPAAGQSRPSVRPS